MKKVLIVNLILSLAVGLRCSTIAVLDLSAVTPYTIINQTNKTISDNETMIDTDSQHFQPAANSDYFNDAQMDQNVTEIWNESSNSSNQTSPVISNYVEVFVFNDNLDHNQTENRQTTSSQVFLVTADELTNGTNDSIAAFNISMYENTFTLSTSSTSKLFFYLIIFNI